MGWAAMLRTEPYTGPTDTVELVDEFLSDCRWRGCAPKTLDVYRWALDKLISEFQDLPLLPRELAPVLDDPSLAQESRRQLLKVFRFFYRWCGREYGAPNPAELLGRIPKHRTLPRVLTDDEMNRLVDVASAPDDEVENLSGGKVLKHHRDKALVLTALDTGLRLGEITGLQVADLQDGWLQVNGKTGERQVPVSPEVLDLIWNQVSGDDVWPSMKGGRLTRRGVQLILSRLIEDAGIKRTRPGQRIGPHCLRHTFATWYIRRGGKAARLSCSRKSSATTRLSQRCFTSPWPASTWPPTMSSTRRWASWD